MTEDQYREQMLTIRYAELAVQTGIYNVLQTWAIQNSSKGNVGHIQWNDTAKILENAKHAMFPPKP